MKRTAILILAVCLLMTPLVVYTQEATATPAPIAETPTDATPPINWVLVTAGIFAVGGLMGALATGLPLYMALRRIDKNTKDNAEKLYEGLPPVWQGTITRVVNMGETIAVTLAEVVKVLKEITDGKPNTDPPAQG